MNGVFLRHGLLGEKREMVGVENFMWQDYFEEEEEDQRQASILDVAASELRQQFNQLHSKSSELRETLRAKQREFIRSRIDSIKRNLKTKKSRKLWHKLTFVLSVSYIWVFAILMFRFPVWLPIFMLFSTSMFLLEAYRFVVPLLTIRYLVYKKKKWHFFMADL